jgi:hypothetical protein
VRLENEMKTVLRTEVRAEGSVVLHSCEIKQNIATIFKIMKSTVNLLKSMSMFGELFN